MAIVRDTEDVTRTGDLTARLRSRWRRLAGGQLHRLLSVLQMRFSDFDRAIHEYTITSGRGIELLGRPPPAIGLLTGLAQLLPSGPATPVGSPEAY